MLLGHRIIICTDHKNLVHPNLHHTSDRVLRLRLLIEEYDMELEYIKEEQNVIADTLLHVPTKEIFTFQQSATNDFPFNLEKLAALQAEDQELQTALTKTKPRYKKIMRSGQELFVHSES
jgi:hypothetical protein